ncbi:type II toxin-antitoxin system RelE family toxin [Paralysiella testudinis]|uniref:Type II toxin-antitoxin system RelE/ParE family toxin n=1 Tax=Paralysiella testudinis TaxID=2809020 RepID=A0A892ZDU9_9NEIS|nr:type II toxin-antitoxin system RelE/ParE family toxin [Paralysiella testudinis]QRQ81535.1 type II toxin-antitoxin system RelE/ParE family toxin [Paralysiella testudinis]
MTWQIRFEKEALKELKKLDPPTARRILQFLNERLAPLENPRSIGEALKGARLGDLWKYRIGDWRIICDIQDQEIILLVVKIGNRRQIYRS